MTCRFPLASVSRNHQQTDPSSLAVSSDQCDPAVFIPHTNETYNRLSFVSVLLDKIEYCSQNWVGNCSCKILRSTNHAVGADEDSRIMASGTYQSLKDLEEGFIRGSSINIQCASFRVAWCVGFFLRSSYIKKTCPINNVGGKRENARNASREKQMSYELLNQSIGNGSRFMAFVFRGIEH